MGQQQNHVESDKDSQFDLPGVKWLSLKLGKDNAAYLLSAYAAFTYALGFVYFNENNFSMPQTTLVRSYCILGLSICIAYKNNYRLDFKNPQDFKYVLTRNLIMLVYASIITASQFYIPLPIVFTLNSIGPLFVFVVDYFTNGVKANSKQILGAICGFVGILFVINGNLLVKWNNPEYQYSSSFENYKNSSFGQLLIIYLLVIVSMVSWAYAAITTRKCTSNSTQINIILALAFIFGGWVMYPLFEQANTQIDLKKLLLALFWSGIPMAFGQFCFVSSLKLTKHTGNLCILGFLSIVATYMVSIFRYGQSVNLYCILGTILTVGGIIRVVLSKQG